MVPRIPGGEITPEKLIVIGEVARDFGLYTKITGGQRIDLLGARVEQLPAIWRRLVDAGFESGHAYGKALRTVKSCVGSTWCRYGVQDSVSLAIELELRYRGSARRTRSRPGCPAAPASAPRRRARTSASSPPRTAGTSTSAATAASGRGTPTCCCPASTRQTLIRTIDRFLMFYIRTADRLQRTATWLEALDGGLDYLRSVIVDDSLGIAAELDAAMARHVADVPGRVGGGARRPGAAAPVRVLRQRAGHPRPEHRLRPGAWPAAPGRPAARRGRGQLEVAR